MRGTAIGFGVYNREIATYCYFHPFLRELRSQKGLSRGDIPLKVPYIYYTNLDTANVDGDEGNSTVLVMEELNSQGFRMIDKRQGCSKEEAMLIMSSLANFHALTHVWLRKHKSTDGSYSLPLSTEYVLKPLNTGNQIVSMVMAAAPTYMQLLQHFGHLEVNQFITENSYNFSFICVDIQTTLILTYVNSWLIELSINTFLQVRLG